MEKRGLLGVLIVLIVLSGCSGDGTEGFSGQNEKIRISITPNPDTGLIQIANEKGYFDEQGLDVTLVNHNYGKASLAAAVNNEVDFAVSAETPMVHAAMRGEKFFIVSKISNSNNLEGIIARKDAGITSISDLTGKTIGTPSGTSAEYFLTNFLLIHGIQKNSVTIVDLKPNELNDAIVAGNIDAVAIWEPEIYKIKKSLGQNSVTFYGDTKVSSFKFYLVGNQDFIHSKPDVVVRLIRSLARAEQFITEEIEEATAIISAYTDTSPEFITSAYRPANAFQLTVDQTMLLALEGQSRWVMSNNLTTVTKVPNYLDYIYIDAMEIVHPKAVTIIR